MMYEFQCSVIFVAPAVMQNNMEPMQVQQMEANLTKLIKEVIGQLGSVEAKLNSVQAKLNSVQATSNVTAKRVSTLIEKLNSVQATSNVTAKRVSTLIEKRCRHV